MSFVITIDGPAGAGKSTTARAVAAALGITYVDTGALYRALALKVMREGVSIDDPDALATSVNRAELALSGSPERPQVWLDGSDVSDEIRTPAVSELSSQLAARPLVRQRLAELQRAMRERGPLVAEGRDLGTVVFPDAEVKIFLDADLPTRARRRARELEQRGLAVPVEEVRAEIERRDARDSGRAESPLVRAANAHHIDTTGIDIEAQVAKTLEAIRSHPGFAAALGARAGGPRGGPGPG